MDFFQSQESLTAVQWILRAVVAYFFMFLIAKFMGQRSISQLRLLDFVIAIIIGNIIAHPLSDEGLGMKGSMISMSVLASLYFVSVLITLKVNQLRKFIDPPPFPLIENGQIVYKSLAKAKISLDYLLSESRKEKIDDIQKVSLAMWEPDGTISFFLNPQHQTVTRADLNIAPKAFSLPRTVIKEGKIDTDELAEIGQSETWLAATLKAKYNTEISQVLLGTVDSNQQLKIILY